MLQNIHLRAINIFLRMQMMHNVENQGDHQRFQNKLFPEERLGFAEGKNGD